MSRNELNWVWQEDEKSQEGLEAEITRRGVTHTSWDIKSSKIRERQGWHPVTYKLADATPSLIQSIKDIDNINYETEYRREWCTSKGKPTPCFLFARKFTRPAALRLLNVAMLGFLYDKLQKEVICLRKSCEKKDDYLNAKDEEIKVLMKKVDTLVRALEVESRKMKREAAAREKNSAANVFYK
ncbi:hypothetical protein POM88_043959 [Heracleum sosnowskyi]|uniref:Uncharacterized protein n=1 Tax=Heracleum sosnowskyi TaxID=360622 RepID=A0AAD8H4H1_9APIA|nr:hypothetical protein POM88_043959 [Heracleum sosnowskyi]